MWARTTANVMSTLGQRLRTERESKGASRADVAQATKVAAHHLAALEFGDFNALPDAVHTKGYVRVYAEYLGIDPTAALAEFLEEYEAACPGAAGDHRDEVVRKMSKMLTGSERSAASKLRPALGIAAVVAVLVLAWLGFRRVGGGGAEAPPEAGTGAGTAPAVAEAQPDAPDLGTESVPAAMPEPAAKPPAEEQARAGKVEPPAAREPQRVARKIQPTAPSEPPPVATETKPAAAAEPRPIEQETAPRQESAAPAAPVAATDSSSPRAGPSNIRVSEYGVGTGVENLRLVGESNRFTEGGRVWFWTRVLNGRSGVEIRHVWRHEGQRIASIPLTLGSANWRTYSRKTMYPGSAGPWTVEAVDAAGNVLASAEFHCDSR